MNVEKKNITQSFIRGFHSFNHHNRKNSFIIFLFRITLKIIITVTKIRKYKLIMYKYKILLQMVYAVLVKRCTEVKLLNLLELFFTIEKLFK
jgi:hypothetical protein